MNCSRLTTDEEAALHAAEAVQRLESPLRIPQAEINQAEYERENVNQRVMLTELESKLLEVDEHTTGHKTQFRCNRIYTQVGADANDCRLGDLGWFYHLIWRSEASRDVNVCDHKQCSRR